MPAATEVALTLDSSAAAATVSACSAVRFARDVTRSEVAMSPSDITPRVSVPFITSSREPRSADPKPPSDLARSPISSPRAKRRSGISWVRSPSAMRWVRSRSAFMGRRIRTVTR